MVVASPSFGCNKKRIEYIAIEQGFAKIAKWTNGKLMNITQGKSGAGFFCNMKSPLPRQFQALQPAGGDFIPWRSNLPAVKSKR